MIWHIARWFLFGLVLSTGLEQFCIAEVWIEPKDFDSWLGGWFEIVRSMFTFIDANFNKLSEYLFEVFRYNDEIFTEIFTHWPPLIFPQPKIGPLVPMIGSLVPKIGSMVLKIGPLTPKISPLMPRIGPLVSKICILSPKRENSDTHWFSYSAKN